MRTNFPSDVDPVALQDYHHLFRKLVTVLCKGRKFLVVGNHLIAKTLLLEAATELNFSSELFSERDEQNDLRVELLLTNDRVRHAILIENILNVTSVSRMVNSI